jgi:hypothetical protein
MNKLILVSSVTSLVFATAAAAGVRVENVTRDIKTKVVDGPTQTVLVQDGKIRVSSGKDNGMILKGSTIVIVDDGKKTYTEMDKEQMKKVAAQANAAMKQMQDKLKNMPPEQRAMMEKMLGNQIPGGLNADKPDVYDAKNTGRTETVEGRKCTVWNLSRNGKLLEEMCVVPFSSLPGKEDFEKSFKEMAEAFAEFSKGMPGVTNQVQVRANVNGYPVRSRSYDAAGNLRGTETVLTKWVEESVPATSFEVPKGYKKKEMPGFGQ